MIPFLLGQNSSDTPAVGIHPREVPARVHGGQSGVLRCGVAGRWGAGAPLGGSTRGAGLKRAELNAVLLVLACVMTACGCMREGQTGFQSSPPHPFPAHTLTKPSSLSLHTE